MSAFALLLDIIEGNLGGYRLRWVVTKFSGKILGSITADHGVLCNDNVIMINKTH